MLTFVFMAASASLCWGLCFPVYRWLVRKRIVDNPNERSSHDQPTARGGGIAIMATIVLGIGVFACAFPSTLLLSLAAGAIAVSVVSLVDDLRSMSPSIRFGCHAAAALLPLAAWGSFSVQLVIVPELKWILPQWLSLALLFLWIVGYTNAFNFMDGINGIAASQAAITGMGMAAVAGLSSGHWNSAPVFLSLLVGVAALGFLPHNFPRARMFMGDVSSAPLGYLLALLVVWLSIEFGWWLCLPLLLLHANFVLDTALTLLRRMINGERWYAAHREHFYQRLIRSGKSHAFVTGWTMVLQLVVLALMLVYLRAGAGGRVLLGGSVLAIWLGSFRYAEVTFRSNQRRQLSTQMAKDETLARQGS